MSLLDRYVFRSFLEPLVLCCGAFIGIWLIFDLSGHGADFISAGASAEQVMEYYSCQLPQVILLVLPIAVLLALLFSMSRMSRSNEVTAMLFSGRSLTRILSPLIAASAMFSGLCLWLNYEMAPQAEALKRMAMDDIRKAKGAPASDEVKGHLFKDRISNRTWFVRKLKLSSPVMEGVQIIEQDAEGNPTRKCYAAKATHDLVKQQWILQRGLIVDVNAQGEVVKMDNFEEQGQRIMENWPETPWRIASSRLDPNQLTVPELQEYLDKNSDFSSRQLAPFQTALNDRLALPLTCLIVSIFAGPLSIVYSRRGIMQGIATAIFLYFMLLVTRNLLLAFGRSARVSPEAAAWGPQLSFFLLGLFLLWLRSGNRELSTIFTSKR
jgi:LPS export ABC transporter permease LptG